MGNGEQEFSLNFYESLLLRAEGLWRKAVFKVCDKKRKKKTF